MYQYPLAGRLVTDLFAVAPGIRAERMSEGGGAILGRVDDVVRAAAGRRIHSGGVADALGYLVVGTRRVAAHAQAADARLPLVQREPAPEHDRAAADLADAGIGLTRGWRGTPG